MGFEKTTWVNGVAPGISAVELNRIETGIEQAAPTGALMMFGGAAAPAGWLLCDGSAVSRTTYDDLFAAISTTFGVGNGSTTFNVPDLRQRFPLGKAVSGTGATLGGTGGTIDPTINTDHSHVMTHGHANTIAYASDGSHTHTGPSHTHTYNISHDHAAANSAGATAGAEWGPTSTPGLYSKDDLAVFSSSTAHAHDDGSYHASGVPVSGTSGTSSASHTHTPTATPHDHFHSVNLPNYSVSNATSGASGTGNTGSSGAHTHAKSGAVTDFTGSTATAGAASAAVPNAPFLSLNFIIKA